MNVTILQDNIPSEPDEQFLVVISNASGGAIISNLQVSISIKQLIKFIFAGLCSYAVHTNLH